MFTCKIEAGFRVFIFIILHFVLTNCIREDMSGCPGMMEGWLSNSAMIQMQTQD